MSDFELRMNVYNRSKIGHANVSFYEDGEHVFTLGANIRVEGPLLALPQLVPFEPDDGVYQDETAYHAQSVQIGAVMSVPVPVTAIQYGGLLSDARALEGQTFNYSVFTEACIELVEDFYAATGHPGEFGDLFAADDRSGSLVWSRVPVSDDTLFSTWPDDQPLYAPPEPIMPDPPIPKTPTVFASMPDPPVFLSGEPVADENVSDIASDSVLQSNAVDETRVEIGNPSANIGSPETAAEDQTVLDDAQIDEARFDQTQEPPAETNQLPADELSSTDLTVNNTSDREAIVDPIRSDRDGPSVSLRNAVSNDTDAEQSSEGWSVGTIFNASSVSQSITSQETPHAAPSPSVDPGPRYDAGADSFDFQPSDSTRDLGFGNEYDGRDLIDALSTPVGDLGFSFDSQPYDDNTDEAAYDHGYDEFGII